MKVVFIMNILTERKGIALGADDFRFIIENNNYYVDKTGFISDILKKKGIQVKLFTRPRRFGKTLNLSMLRYFFAIGGLKPNKALFTGFGLEG